MNAVALEVKRPFLANLKNPGFLYLALETFLPFLLSHANLVNSAGRDPLPLSGIDVNPSRIC